jgi:hypothetical protein
MVTFLNHLKICQWFPITIKILSNFQTLFRSTFLNDKHPVVFMKDMEFENLKSLVEYMYKGEANVPQHMLSAFIKDAESLQIRGLAECASKQFEAEQLGSSSTSTPSRSHPGPHHSTPNHKKSRSSASAAAAAALGPGGILAARLAKMGGADPSGAPINMFDFTPENFPGMLPRHPALGGTPHLPPPMKKSRKSTEPRPRGASPIKDPNMKLKIKSQNVPTNNNYGDDDEGGLKIDEDADPGKENLEAGGSTASNKMDDDIADMDNSNGVSEEEEEPSMPGPGGELGEAPSK